MSLCGVSPGSPFSMKMAQSIKVVVCHASGRLIGLGATSCVALTMCLHSTESKPL